MKWYLLVIGALLLTFIVLSFTTTPNINEGLAFAVSNANGTVFGTNEDRQTGEPIIYFRRATSSTYGSVMFGYQESGEQYYESGLNEAGLAWDFVPMPGAAVTPHSAREYRFTEDDVFLLMMQTTATVDEALDLLEQVDFGLYINGQIVLADALGNTVVVSPDETGEMVYSTSSEDYLVAANFNPALEDGEGMWRYDETVELLQNAPTNDLIGYGLDVLRDISLNNDLRFTLYSASIDLETKQIQLAYKRQYDDAITFTLDEYLAQYNQQFLMKDLFEDDVVAAGTANFNAFDQANQRVQIISIIVGMALNASVIALLIKWMRDDKKQQPQI